MTSATDEPRDPQDLATTDTLDPHASDDHAHADGEALGSVDLRAWGAGVLGIVGGLIVAAVLAIGAGWLG